MIIPINEIDLDVYFWKSIPLKNVVHVWITCTNKLLLSLENPISTFFPFSSRLLLFPIHFFCIIWSLINHVSYHAHGQGIINCSSLISVSFHSVDMYLFFLHKFLCRFLLSYLKLQNRKVFSLFNSNTVFNVLILINL